MGKLRIQFLNHSCLVFESEDYSLVVDPWLEGSAFSGGWALEWHNPDALLAASRASGIWISHPHSDHMHFETLKKLSALNPKMTVWANSNGQVDLAKILAHLPFEKVVSVPERRSVRLSATTSIMALPSLAIDSVLAYRAGDLFVLNVNDAIIDPQTLRLALDKTEEFRNRRPDVVLINFSHASKIDEENVPALSANYKERLRRFVEVFNPRVCLPIASFHLYTGKFAVWQNATRVLPEDLLDIDKVSLFKPGYFAHVDSDAIEVEAVELKPAVVGPREYNRKVSVAELEVAVAQFSVRLRSQFFGVYLPKNLVVKFTDLEAIFRIDFRDGNLRRLDETPTCDMECYSEPFLSMLTKPYGFDSFYVAADYSIPAAEASRKKVRDFIFKGCLMDYRITPKRVVQSVFEESQWRFLRNRREQFWHIVSKGYTMGGV